MGEDGARGKDWLIGHGGITCVLQTQFSSSINYMPQRSLLSVFLYCPSECSICFIMICVSNRFTTCRTMAALRMHYLLILLFSAIR